MRRQTTTSRVTPAGSSRDERLDPFGLPAALRGSPTAPADERMRLVELHRERVVLRRALARHQDGAQTAGRRLSWRGDPDGAATRHGGRAPSPSCSSIPIPACRSRFIAPPTAPTSSPNGGAWGRTLGAAAPGRRGRRAPARAVRPDRRRSRRTSDLAPTTTLGAEAAPPRAAAATTDRHAVRQRRSCIAAIARSSRGISAQRLARSLRRPSSFHLVNLADPAFRRAHDKREDLSPSTAESAG